MKSLNGRELVGYIKERQAKQVRSLRGRKVFPKLAIFYDNDSPVIAKYMSLKQKYGDDINIAVEIQKITSADAEQKLKAAAEDPNVTGIIVQLPLVETSMDILDLIPVEKDVD